MANDQKLPIVSIKWQKSLYENIEIDTGNPPAVFKMQLFSLTGVPPERQKIMGFKGGLLKDDADWNAVGLKDGLKVTMMGTADKVPEAPTAAQTFVEDLPEEEQDVTGMSKYGAGLENLGNTCYMNSTVQCLYAVPELRESLASVTASPNEPGAALAAAARNLFVRMEKAGQAVPPTQFLICLRRMFPQFDQTNREGAHMQQDAEECWGALLTALKAQTPEIQKLFGVSTRAVLKCEDMDGTSTGETMTIDEVELMLKCNITSDVNHLSEGLALGFRGDREKTSETLGRLATFRGVAEIQALPPYLTVQMVRFFYKADVQQKAKILRKVTFPMLLDLFDFATEELKTALKAPRLAYKEAEDAKVGLSQKRQKLAADGGAGTSTTTATAAKDNGDVEMVDNIAQYAGALTGRYELIGVLTHKGRSADSGHYVSWVKQNDGQWVQFDDDNMILRKEEEVLALSGGGDWHMAYLLLFKAQRCPMDIAETVAAAAAAAEKKEEAPATADGS
jgi:ubiquitin carboxyl-terminal hydrolase 14